MFKKLKFFVVIGTISFLSVSVVSARMDINNNEQEEDEAPSQLEEKIEGYKTKISEEEASKEEETHNSNTTVSQNEENQRNVTISTTTTSATSKVEYYAEPAKGTDNTRQKKSKITIPTYIGTAEEKGDGSFELDVDAERTLPNGTYELKTKLHQEDGSIVEGKKKTIAVTNPVVNMTSEEKQKFEKSEADTDNDGIPDKEEIRLGTNPLLADSDGDGFLDGDEIRNGFNPLKFSPGDKSDKIIFELPKETPTIDTKFSVDDVAMASVTPSDSKQSTTKKIARFSGKALPNIFVTLYIFSDPIVVTVKTDANGNWSYDLDKEIPDGNHEVYVAVTDNVGKITAQSHALPFVKTADAIDIVPVVEATSVETVQQNATPLEKSKTQFILIAFVIITTFVGIALIIIGRKSSFIK